MATVLFADLSGYTAVAEQMDPEAVKSLLDRALRRLGQEVFRYGGSVDKYIGDNVMGVFGAPVAHEDDPERAVRAGLGMQAAMDEINDEIADPSGVEFALRVGINSGEVLAGQVGPLRESLSLLQVGGDVAQSEPIAHRRADGRPTRPQQ